MNDTFLWCPKCGEIMTIKQEKSKNDENWICYCKVCDKYFTFEELKLPIQDFYLGVMG